MRVQMLAIVLVFPLTGATGQSISPAPGEPVPQISVSAQGEIRVTPDRATLSVTVETRRPLAAQASQENARIQHAVFDTLKSLGVAADHISTTDYTVMPEQRWDQRQQRSEVTGYVVRNTIRIRVLRLDQLGSIIDASLKKGSNVVTSLDLFAANTDQARRQALAEAVEKARADADVIAKAAGGSIAGLLEIVSEEYRTSPPVPMQRMAMAKAEAGSVETPIGAGSQLLQARVSTRWRFAPVTR